MEDLKSSRGIQSVDYTAEILELFCKRSTSLSLTEIASEMNASPAKIFPYLVSLVRARLIQKCEQNNYQIGQLTLNLAFKALNYLDPLEETAKIAKQIAMKTEHLTILSSWGAFGPTVIRTFESNSNLHSKIRVGSSMSIMNSSVGYTFARFLPEETIKESLKFEEFRYSGTKVTDTQKKEFLKDIQTAHFNDVYTITENEPAQGMSSMSVPVFSLSNELLYVITIFDNSEKVLPYTEQIKAVINEKLLVLSRTLGIS